MLVWRPTLNLVSTKPGQDHLAIIFIFAQFTVYYRRNMFSLLSAIDESNETRLFGLSKSRQETRNLCEEI